MWAVLRLRNSCGHATLPRSILPSRSKLHARGNTGEREEGIGQYNSNHHW